VANINAPGQVVVAGGADDIEWAAEHARDHGIRRAIPLKVAGAFHTPFMASAAADLQNHIDATDFAPPRFPVYANLTGSLYPSEIGPTLVGQLTGQVRFEASVEAMAADVDVLVHVGPGDVTAGMAKRISVDTPTLTVNSVESIQVALAALEELES
jgi:[acyl-carrier-protein] S-malonyltransferase